ncbi:MAG: Isoprenyl transferase [Desulfotomaculum sp. 46_296]|nr:MAG: Isoprenyl transferase [Desulfotomaculum sp. 46_296]
MLKNMANTILNIFFKRRTAPDEKQYLSILDRSRLPEHIAIIMDGNGRWAQRRGLPRSIGHRAGVESLRDIVKLCAELKIRILTVYAFSTENWKRPQEEVNTLMELLVEYLQKEIDELCDNDIRVMAIGHIKDLPEAAKKCVHLAQERSHNNQGLTLNLALNYGGRNEIIEALRAVSQKICQGELSLGDINETLISSNLYTAGQPDPDLLIRPSGDYRISNFLLWQIAYTEFWLTPVLWPDFRRIHLLQALIDYQRRERRFGGLS